MRHKGQYTTAQLKRLALMGHDVFPVFGRPVEMVTLRHRPRSKFDPKPWVWGDDGLRYSAWELTAEPHKPTDGELAELRHEVEDTTDFVRTFLPCAGATERRGGGGIATGLRRPLELVPRGVNAVPADRGLAQHASAVI